MYCIFARESIEKMGGNRGKLAAQAGHAFVGAYAAAATFYNGRLHDWDIAGSPKIVLVTDAIGDLMALRDAYVKRHPICYVTDAGKTVFSEKTTTCIAVGPIADEDVGGDLKDLKVLL